MAAIPSRATWLDSVDQLREILGIRSNSEMKCHGVTKRDTGCSRALSQSSGSQICSLLAQIFKKGNLLAAKSLLGDLAFVALCVRDHQKQKEQTNRLFLKWVEVLSDLEPEIKLEPGLGDTVEISAVSVQQVKLEGSPAETTAFGTPLPVQEEILEELDTKINIQIKVEEIVAMDTTADFTGEHTVSKQPQRKKRQSKVKSTAGTKPKHKFARHKQIKSALEINKFISKLITKNLLGSEKPTSEEGYIYMYTFPEDYRMASPYIKIGYTKDRDARMKKWANQCGYQPKVLGHFPAELYVKVEKLVQLHLANERRVEKEGCPQCGVKHQEWFEIKFSRAATSVGLWIDWARREPYDENGVLKSQWKNRLESMDLENKDCWDSFVNDDFDEEESLGHSESESDDSESESLYDDDYSGEEEDDYDDTD